MERSPVRNAMSTASIAAGSNSKMVFEVLMAAAAIEPVQSPRTAISEECGNGLDPSPWNLRGVSTAKLQSEPVTYT